MYVNAEYLLWWLKSASTPPLATVALLGGPHAGAIGAPGTFTAYGGTLGQLNRAGIIFLNNYAWDILAGGPARRQMLRMLLVRVGPALRLQACPQLQTDSL